MQRPLKHFAYKLGRDLHMDVDIIMSWPVGKLYEYMAFYISEDSDWQEKYKEEQMTPEERTKRLMNFLSQSRAKK